MMLKIFSSSYFIGNGSRVENIEIRFIDIVIGGYFFLFNIFFDFFIDVYFVVYNFVSRFVINVCLS